MPRLVIDPHKKMFAPLKPLTVLSDYLGAKSLDELQSDYLRAKSLDELQSDQRGAKSLDVL